MDKWLKLKMYLSKIVEEYDKAEYPREGQIAAAAHAMRTLKQMKLYEEIEREEL